MAFRQEEKLNPGWLFFIIFFCLFNLWILIHLFLNQKKPRLAPFQLPPLQKPLGDFPEVARDRSQAERQEGIDLFYQRS